ncbi:RHTO0S07e08262g1_1 [Rhodotorula toruloides]|uniref:RHTO0S07e08262g1_1 n=1 Tax=Rhodotorula toruloides TaxID=5286 RepID=A0A061AZM7_RHOTO|nr:RHTO0S07e08262g1_1 [Rhodotorula toruloides]
MRALIANLLAALRSLASYAPPSCSLVIVAAVAAFMPTPRLQERLPTEILSAIISFDYLTWPALDVCSPVSRRLRQIALPERGAAPPVEISIISGSGRYSWTVEAPSSRGCWAHARRHRAYGAKVRRLEISLGPARGSSWAVAKHFRLAWLRRRRGRRRGRGQGPDTRVRAACRGPALRGVAR